MPQQSRPAAEGLGDSLRAAAVGLYGNKLHSDISQKKAAAVAAGEAAGEAGEFANKVDELTGKI